MTLAKEKGRYVDASTHAYIQCSETDGRVRRLGYNSEINSVRFVDVDPSKTRRTAEDLGIGDDVDQTES